MRHRRRASGGFTLIEVIVALSVVILMGVIAMEPMAGAFALRNFYEDEDQVVRAGRVARARRAWIRWLSRSATYSSRPSVLMASLEHWIAMPTGNLNSPTRHPTSPKVYFQPRSVLSTTMRWLCVLPAGARVHSGRRWLVGGRLAGSA